jgi:hypothetical protein
MAACRFSGLVVRDLALINRSEAKRPHRHMDQVAVWQSTGPHQDPRRLPASAMVSTRRIRPLRGSARAIHGKRLLAPAEPAHMPRLVQLVHAYASAAQVLGRRLAYRAMRLSGTRAALDVHVSSVRRCGEQK